MGLKRVLPCLSLVVGCSDSGFEVGEERLPLPTTLEQALPGAVALAREWEPDGTLYGMGGGYTVMDADGLSFNHSFRFYSLAARRALDLHFFAGTAWAEERTGLGSFPAPLDAVLDRGSRLTSDVAIHRAIDAAVDSVPRLELPERCTAELLSYPVWPERQSGFSVSDSLAWRVDFLEENWETGRMQWVSAARVYVHPVTGEIFQVMGRPLSSPRRRPTAGTASDSRASSAGTRR